MAAFEERQEAVSFAESLLDGFWSPEEYYGFLSTFKYDDVGVILDKYTIVEANRIRTIYNWLQYFSPKTLQSEFEQAGFTQCKFYDDVAGAPFSESGLEFAIVASRK